MQSLKAKFNTKIVYITLVVMFIVFCSFFVQNNVKNKVLFATNDLTNNEIQFDREEIKIDNVNLYSDVISAKAGENVKLNFDVEPYYSYETIKKIEYKIISGKNYASVNNDGILSIFDYAKAYEDISVKVWVNGIGSNTVKISIDKTKVEDFEISSNTQTIREGGTSIVYVNKLLPQNASFQKVKYEIIDGSQYAMINSQTGEIKVNDVVNVKDAIVTVCAYTCENYDKQSNEITFSIYVPLKNMKLSASKSLVKISSTNGDKVELTATTDDVVSVFNPTYMIDPLYNNFAYIENNILFINKNIKESVIIPVWAQQDGAESNTVYIQIYILAEDIILNDNINTIKVSQFLTYDFSAKVYPSYANSKNITYKIIDLNDVEVDYAEINENGQLYIKDEAPNSSQLKLQLKHDDLVKTIILEIEEYKSSSILIENNNLPKVLYPNQRVDFVAVFDNLYKTQNHFNVLYAFGDDGVFYNYGNYIIVKPLNELEKLGKNQLQFSIKLKSSTGTYSKEQQFDVFLPVESMQNQVLYVDRGTEVYVDMLFNSNNLATDKSLKEISNVMVKNEIVTIEKTNIRGQIKISLPTNLEYNTNINIDVYAQNSEINCTITLIINGLSLDNFGLLLDKQDSEGHIINKKNPELYVGRSLYSQITYKNNSILEYGLTIEKKSSTNSNIESEDDILKLTANDVAGGSAILYFVTLKDGNTTKLYNIGANNISVFNPADTTDAIYIEDINHIKNNAITFYGPTLDLLPYYRYNDSNDSPITSKWITSQGAYANENTISIINTTPWDGFDIIIHYTQTYNGIEREVGQTKIKASLGFDKKVYQEYSEFGNNVEVTGVDDGTGWFFGTTYHGSDSMDLSGGRVSRGFLVTTMEYEKLKEAGFSKVQITLELDIAEIQDGYQEIYVLFDNDCDVNNGYIEAYRNGYVEHTASGVDTSWWTHTFTFEVSIDTLINNRYIAIACGAHGKGNDTWRWGWTRLNFEAIA